MDWAFPANGTFSKLTNVRTAFRCVSFWITALALFGTVAADAATIFPTNSVWKYLKGFSEASSPDSTAWRGTTFDDGSWAAGTAPFYYGESLSGTLLGDMQNNYTCVFLRRNFVVTNQYEFGTMTLSARCDDGYIAWINGVEVARYNMPAGFVPYNGLANLSVS